VLAYKIEQILKSLELEKVNQNPPASTRTKYEVEVQGTDKERTIPSMVKDQELKL